MKPPIPFNKATLEPFPVLETARMRLRKIEQSDAEAVLFQRSNSKVLKYMDREPYTELQQATEFITKILEDWKAKEGITWILESKDTQTFLGDIALWRFFDKDHRAEIGYGLHPDYWHQGYMKEAAAAVLDWSFTLLGLHSILADINPNNDASKQLLLSLGFKKEGYHRENYYFRGEYLDSEMYGLLERDFRAACKSATLLSV